MIAPRAPVFAGVELGGTKCICTLAEGPERVIDQCRIPTTRPDETLPAIAAVLDQWRGRHGFDALGLASFGPLDLDRASSRYGHITATTKRGWRDTDILEPLSARYGVPVAIDTDVVGAALAEGRWGAAQGLSSFVYITVGTGVGVGIIIDGRAVCGRGHPEAGHLHVRRAAGDAWPGACLFHGDCVEGLASGFAIEARTGRAAATIAADDPVWPLVARAIAGLCHSLVMAVVPERILIGGGVMMRQPQLLPMVRAMLVEGLGGYGDADRIAAGIESFLALPALGDDAGPLGAIALARDAATGTHGDFSKR